MPTRMAADLYLRKVQHLQAPHNYRVILKRDGDEFEIGSIGIQYMAGTTGVWRWSIDTVLPMRSLESEGEGRDRADCTRQFRAAWIRFASDDANLIAFLDAKHPGRR